MTRVAYIAGRYPSISQTFVLREVRALRSAGVTVDTLSIWRTSPENLLARADREEAATTFAALPASPLTILWSQLNAVVRRPLGYLRALRKAWEVAAPGVRNRVTGLAYFVEAIICWQHVRRLGASHVHAQFTGNAATAAMLIAILERGRRRPFTWSMAVHGPLEFYNVANSRLAAKVSHADFVLAISDYARSQLMALVPAERWSDIEVVHCGVDPSVFTADTAQPTPVSADGLQVLCVGRLVNLKGHAVLLEAVAALQSRGIRVHATLVGDGPNRASLEDRARALELDEHVRFTGAVGQDEIRALYTAADVFCLPSFGEGVPVVLMEAMAMCKPVVTTRITGIPELVEDDVNGILVSPGRADQLADALERLARDPEAQARMGAAGRAKVLAEFDVRRSGEQLARIYTERLTH